MSDLKGFQQWLERIQRQPVFINNYWNAQLSRCMEALPMSNKFKMPHFVIEGELEKEENQFEYISDPIKYLLIDLLKQHEETVDESNYEDKLRRYLETVTPVGVAPPLGPEDSFHALPSECKLWMLYQLLSGDGKDCLPEPIMADPAGNAYYLLPGNRIYARLKSEPPVVDGTESAPQEEAASWAALRRFVLAPLSFKLVAETSEDWTALLNAFRKARMPNCYNRLRPESFEVPSRSARKLERDAIRSGYLARLKVPESLTKPEGAESTHTPTEKSEQKICKPFDQTSVPPKQTLRPTYTGRQSTPTKTVQPDQAEKKSQLQNKKKFSALLKCWDFPNCKEEKLENGNRCMYSHPTTKCGRAANECPDGWRCNDLHEVCPNDGRCELDKDCPYEHSKSITTYHRKSPEERHKEYTLIAAAKRHPIARTKSSTNLAKGSELPQSENGFATERRRRIESRPYTPAPPLSRAKSSNNLASMKQLTRSNGNLSMQRGSTNRSGTSRAKSQSRKSFSQCNDGSSDDGSFEKFRFSDEEKETAKKPRPPSTNPGRPQRSKSLVRGRRTRCYFWNRKCNQGDACPYAHPSEKCRYFPRCRMGGACPSLHEDCEKYLECALASCDYEHDKSRVAVSKWCPRGSRCTLENCSEMHPKTCEPPCPSPGHCWMYHRPAQRPWSARPPSARPRTPSARSRPASPLEPKQAPPPGDFGAVGSRPRTPGAPPVVGGAFGNPMAGPSPLRPVHMQQQPLQQRFAPSAAPPFSGVPMMMRGGNPPPSMGRGYGFGPDSFRPVPPGTWSPMGSRGGEMWPSQYGSQPGYPPPFPAGPYTPESREPNNTPASMRGEEGEEEQLAFFERKSRNE